MASDHILTFEDLQHATGYSRRADVERSLSSQGIRLFHGKNGPWTTIELINHAAGIGSGSNGKYDPDIIGPASSKKEPRLRLGK